MSGLDQAALDHFRQAGKRTISRWVAPLPQESIHGFFLRLADKHLQTSARAFAEEFDINIDWDDTTALKEAIFACHYGTAEDRTALAAWSARIEGSQVHLGSERVARDDFSMRTRRFCPGCLDESAHHRAWFDLRFMITCPLHGAEIVDCVDGSYKANWLHPDIAFLASGERLARTMPRLAVLPATLEAYVLGRFGLVPKPDVPLADGEALTDVVGAVETIGRLAIGGYMRAMPYVGTSGFARADVLAHGWDILRGGRSAVKTLLQEIAAAAPPMAYGSVSLFGCAYAYLAPRPGVVANPIETVLFELMKEIGRELGRRGRHHTDPRPLEDSTFVTIAELAEAIGRTADATFLVARAIEVLEPHPGTKGTPHLVKRAHLRAVREFMERTLTREEAADYLAVPPDTFDQIVLSRHIAASGNGWSETGRNCDMYDRLELDRMLDAIPVEFKVDKWTPANGRITVPDLLAQTCYDAGGFLGEVFSGALKICARREGDRGLAAFWFQPQRQTWGHNFLIRCRSLQVTRNVASHENGMSIALAAALLEVSPGTVKALLERGYLGRVDIQGGNSRKSIDAMSVHRFAGLHLPAKFYADALGCPPIHVTRQAARYDVAPIMDTTNRGTERVAPIYERAAMRRALRLRYDPDHNDNAREGWKEMSKSLEKANSLFSLIQIHDDLSATFSTTDAAWPIRISYDFETEVPLLGFEAESAYTLRATFEITGKKAEKRIDEIERALASRELHGLLTASVDRAAGICRATTFAHVIDHYSHGAKGAEVVWLRADTDAQVIDRLLNMIKTTLETGPRTYDHRMFGPPTRYYYRA